MFPDPLSRSTTTSGSGPNNVSLPVLRKQSDGTVPQIAKPRNRAGSEERVAGEYREGWKGSQDQPGQTV